MAKEKSKDRAWTVADLEALRADIDAAIGVLKRLEGFSGGSTGEGIFKSLPPPTDDPGRGDESDDEIRSDTFFNLSKTDAAQKYLQMGKRPKSTKDIGEALRRGGILSQSQNFEVTVHTALTRDKRFIRVKKEWGLAEWYGAGPKRKSQRSDEGE